MAGSKDKAKWRTTKGLRPLLALTEALIGRSLRDRGYLLNQILILWPQIAGDAASWSRPVSMSFTNKKRKDGKNQKSKDGKDQKRKDGTLTLAIDSGRGPAASMMTPQMITNINMACGYPAVSRIRLQQTGMTSKTSGVKPESTQSESPPPKKAIPLHDLEESTQQIHSPELRAALIRLGQHLHKS